MNASDFLENLIIAHLFRTATWTKPAALYIALYTAAPPDAGGGTEVAGGGYARVACNPGDANWAAPVSGNGQTSNVSTVAFPTPTASWGTVVAFGILDAASGGNLLVWGSLTSSQAIASGSPVQFAAGALTVTVS